MGQTPPLKLPFRLGLDGIAGSVRQSENYPPYDLVRLPGGPRGRERLRLVFAVAGFAPGELDVSVTDRHLVVRGEQRQDGSTRQFIHRGIAARRFQRLFRLSDGLDVLRADLDQGLLSIELERREDAAAVTSITIKVPDR